MSPYPTRQLGRNGPVVSAIGYGAMGIGAFYGTTDEEESFKTLTAAADRGITFWDTADIYGSSEVTLGKWFASTGRRSEIFLATKFGSMDFSPGATNQYKPNSKPSYIHNRIETALKALQTDYIDLFYQHRVDPEVPIEVVLETFRPYVKSGKIKYIGLSECSANELRRAKAVQGVGEKVIAAQMEYSPFEVEIETSGFSKVAKELGVGIVAYSPLGRGLITGRFKSPDDLEESDLRRILPRFSAENFPNNLALVDKFKTVADKHDATPGQIALAWILNTQPTYIPIPGSRGLARLEENAKAAEISLTPENLKVLQDAVDAADVKGARYPDFYVAAQDSIPLSEWKGE